MMYVLLTQYNFTFAFFLFLNFIIISDSVFGVISLQWIRNSCMPGKMDHMIICWEIACWVKQKRGYYNLMMHNDIMLFGQCGIG